MPPKLTTEKWIYKFDTKFSNNFIFNKTIYTGAQTPIIVTCKTHGDIHYERAQSALYPKRYPCRYCLGFLPVFDGTQKWLRKWLYYNRKDGYLYIRATNSRLGFLKQDGYINISFDGKAYQAHRLIYKYLKNKYPSMIDHKNRDRSDNRFKNLRGATSSLNSLNREAVRMKYTYGKYEASIKYMNKTVYLGRFEYEIDAQSAIDDIYKKLIKKEKKKVIWIDSDIV